MDPMYAGWLLSALGAAIALVAAWLLYPRGREPGPGRAALVMLAVALGLLPFGLVLGAAFLWLGLLPAVPKAIATAFLAAAIPEEAFKGAAVWWLVFRARPVRCVQDGAFHGVVAGVAFALVENLAYIYQAESALGMGEQVAFLRVVMAAPGHACYAAILGHHLALAALAGGLREPAGRRLAWRGLAIAAGFHGCYDAALMLSAATGTAWLAFLAVPIFMGSVVAAFVCMERARKLDDRRLASVPSPRRGRSGP